MVEIKIRGFLTREPDPVLLSYQVIGEAIDRAIDAGEDVVLDIDSGGGDAIGVRALAESIYTRRDKISAYVSGYAASAAYYIAAACGRIVAAEDAAIGSVGSIAWPPELGDAKVAKLSPLKNSGEDLQGIVDDACERFLADVAKYRGFSGSPEEISVRCGEGALMPARKALELQLIDEVKDMDELDREELDAEGIATMLPKIVAWLDELAQKLDSADERIGLIEERMRADEEPAAEGEPAEKCEVKSEDLNVDEEEKKDEDDKTADIVDCLIDCLKRDGKISAKEESRAIRLLNADVSLFKDIFVKRETPSLGRVSMPTKSAQQVEGKTRNERARNYMKLTGCTYAAALAREIEKESNR